MYPGALKSVSLKHYLLEVLGEDLVRRATGRRSSRCRCRWTPACRSSAPAPGRRLDTSEPLNSDGVNGVFWSGAACACQKAALVRAPPSALHVSEGFALSSCRQLRPGGTLAQNASSLAETMHFLRREQAHREIVSGRCWSIASSESQCHDWLMSSGRQDGFSAHQILARQSCHSW